jgi:hypothetical protein
MAGLRLHAPMLHPERHRSQRRACGQSQWLVVLCKTLSFSFPSRFIPALSPTPVIEAVLGHQKMDRNCRSGITAPSPDLETRKSPQKSESTPAAARILTDPGSTTRSSEHSLSRFRKSSTSGTGSRLSASDKGGEKTIRCHKFDASGFGSNRSGCPNASLFKQDFRKIDIVKNKGT